MENLSLHARCTVVRGRLRDPRNKDLVLNCAKELLELIMKNPWPEAINVLDSFDGCKTVQLLLSSGKCGINLKGKTWTLDLSEDSDAQAKQFIGRGLRVMLLLKSCGSGSGPNMFQVYTKDIFIF